MEGHQPDEKEELRLFQSFQKNRKKLLATSTSNADYLDSAYLFLKSRQDLKECIIISSSPELLMHLEQQLTKSKKL